MKKKSTQRIAAWLLAAGMMAGTFAQPMAVYAESTASVAASDSTTGDSITADADVVIATPTPEPDTGTDTAATPVPTADSQTPQDPASTAAPESTPAPDAAEDAPTPAPTPVAEDTSDDAADTDDTTNTTTTVTPADLQSCIALLAASQLSLDADSIEPDVREETLALSDEITETEPSTLQAVVNAAVYAAPAGQTNITVDVPANNYTGTLVIPDATIVGKDASGSEINIEKIKHSVVFTKAELEAVYSEFLGFKLKVRKRSNKYVVQSHLCRSAEHRPQRRERTRRCKWPIGSDTGQRQSEQSLQAGQKKPRSSGNRRNDRRGSTAVVKGTQGRTFAEYPGWKLYA